MDIVSTAKNIGAILATATTIAYISGYLALRTRAHALGTDPAFTLVDEGYVFAGFRFFFITLIMLILLAPAILFLCWIAVWIVGHLSHHLVQPVQWCVLTLLALVTIIMLFRMLQMDSLLLRECDATQSSIAAVIIEGRSNMGLLFSLMLVLCTSLSVLWLKFRLSIGIDSLGMLLGTIVTIQLFLLPMTHGALFVDRKVRVLGTIPDRVQNLVAPVGVVSRTREHVTLLGLNPNRERQLTTVRLDDLNGIPTIKIVKLDEFLMQDLGVESIQVTTENSNVSVDEKLSSAETLLNQGKNQDLIRLENGESFLQILMNHLRFTFEAIGSLGESVVNDGELWSVELNSTGVPQKPYRITEEEALSWPVIGHDGETIFALRQSKIVRLNLQSQSFEPVADGSNWEKLLGVTLDGTILGLVSKAGDIRYSLLTPEGTVTILPSPLSDEDKRRRSRLIQENRSYVGGITLQVKESERGRGYDVYMVSGTTEVNLSDCGDHRCGQPSLSPDLQRILYIRQPLY